jgi:hypothetical protein
VGHRDPLEGTPREVAEGVETEMTAFIDAAKQALSSISQPVYVIHDGWDRYMIISSLTSYNITEDSVLVSFNVSDSRKNDFFTGIGNCFAIHALTWDAMIPLDLKIPLEEIVKNENYILWSALGRTDASIFIFGKHQIIASLQTVTNPKDIAGLMYRGREFTY